MARNSFKSAPAAPTPVDEAQPAAAPVVQPQPSYMDDMVSIRAVGGVFIDPYTHIRFDETPQRVVVTSWVQAQIDAKKLVKVQD